ncbi:uncharacterized protein LOC113798148 [Dermatophagoides pteronyssinus]|uniref:uncharacterized protein LOC113798148 n=1 Tax=Dermatophagoides pteronyssinus TaxID=6956 RepID=UPI003F66D24D
MMRMAAFKCLFVIFGSFLIVPEIVGQESETTTTTTDIVDLITTTTTTILPLSSSKTNATLDDNNGGDAEKDVKENDKRRANALIKSMRRLPGWYLTSHYIGGGNKMNQPNLPSSYKQQQQQHAQFANGWRAVSLLTSSKIPSRIPISTNSNQVAIPVSVVPIISTTTTTVSSTEKSISTTATAEEDIEKSNVAFSPMPIKIDNPKPIRIDMDDKNVNQNNQTYEMKCLINGKQYSNGEQITIPDDGDNDNPCTYCRCFYGQKICQQHICPSAPSLDCLAEQKSGQCCPIYTCKSIQMENNASPLPSDDSTNISHSTDQESMTETFFLQPIRSRGPQFIANVQSSLSSSANHSQRRNGMLMPMNPLEFLYNNNNNNNDNPSMNRVHFPTYHKSSSTSSSSITQSPIDQIKDVNWSNLATKFNPKLPINDIIRVNDKDDENEKLTNFEPMEQQQATTNSSPFRTRPQSPLRPISTHKLSSSSSSSVDRDYHLLRPSLSSNSYNPLISTTSKPLITTTTTTTSATIPVNNNNNNLMPNIFQVSSCNIYGKMYEIDKQIEELSNHCKICICSITGVKCTDDC